MKTCKRNHSYPKEKSCCPECRRLWDKTHAQRNRNKTNDWQKANPEKHKALAKRKRYEASKLHRTPPWLTPEQHKSIELFYTTAKWLESFIGEPIHVDHIIPLQGKNVSGLHAPWNLQLLPASENMAKGNKL